MGVEEACLGSMEVILKLLLNSVEACFLGQPTPGETNPGETFLYSHAQEYIPGFSQQAVLINASGDRKWQTGRPPGKGTFP